MSLSNISINFLIIECIINFLSLNIKIEVELKISIKTNIVKAKNVDCTHATISSNAYRVKQINKYTRTCYYKTISSQKIVVS